MFACEGSAGERLRDLIAAAAAPGDHEVFLARVVVEDCLTGNAGNSRDVVVGRLFEPAGYEQFGGRVKQAFASLALALLTAASGAPGFSGRLRQVYDDVVCRYLISAGCAIVVHYYSLHLYRAAGCALAVAPAWVVRRSRTMLDVS